MQSLQLTNVAYKIGSARILDEISLTLFAGELCALIGPSGAGKSTLIKLLLGINEPDAGDILLDGRAIQAGPSVGYVPQDDALHVSLKVRQALKHTAKLRLPGLSAAQRERKIKTVCAQLGISDQMGQRIKHLSGGQRKRVSVALEMLVQPTLLILDEPTSGLDPGLEAALMAQFAKLAGSDRIVLVSTHTMQSLSLAQSLLVMHRGCLVYFGSPSDALLFFYVDNFNAIFPQLDTHPVHEWQEKYRLSGMAASFAERRQRAATLQKPSAAVQHGFEEGSERAGDKLTAAPSEADEILARIKREMKDQE